MYHGVVVGEQDDIRSASRALKDAAAAFSRAFGQVLSEAGTQASREIADELRQATKDLNEAAAAAGFEFGEQRRSPRAERTRAELLDAAGRVFADKGYEGASVGDVAAAAGYTKGAVYANFGSKEDLFLELARELTAADARLRTPPASGDPDLRDVFALGPASDEQTERTLLGLELYLYAIRHPEARADLAPLLAAGNDGVAALVRRSRMGSSGAGSSDAGGSSDVGSSDVGSSGSSGEPTVDDRDLAFSLVAVHTLGALVGPLLAPGEGSAAVRRIVGRLLESR